MPRKADKAYSFNLIDFLIITLLVIAICALIFVIIGGDIKKLTAERVEVSYTLYIDNAYLDNFSIGDTIVTKNGSEGGTITSIVGLYTDENMSMIIVSAEAYSVKKDLFINGQLLASEKSFSVVLKDGSELDTFCASVIQLIK